MLNLTGTATRLTAPTLLEGDLADNRDDQLYKIRPVNTCLFVDRTSLGPIVPPAGHGGNWPETPRFGPPRSVNEHPVHFPL